MQYADDPAFLVGKNNYNCEKNNEKANQVLELAQLLNYNCTAKYW